jgi:hypothetical protein
MDNATRVQILCEACDFFFVLIRLFPLNFGNFFFAYGQRYALEISTTKGVIDHADSEYAVFIDREHFLQNRSGVICNLRIAPIYVIVDGVYHIVYRLVIIHFN